MGLLVTQMWPLLNSSEPNPSRLETNFLYGEKYLSESKQFVYYHLNPKIWKAESQGSNTRLVMTIDN